MKVRMKVAVSGTWNGQPWPPPGEVAERPDDQAEALIAGGMAERVEERPAAEPPEENAKKPDGDVEKRPALKGGRGGGRARRSDG